MTATLPDHLTWHGAEPSGSARKVYLGILSDLERGRMVPGQRLVETELAQRFEVGRNAVREAIQHLAGRGVVDLSPNRSPVIRRLDSAEVFEVIDVAEVMTRLVARAAALRFGSAHVAPLAGAMDELAAAAETGEPAQFSRARRRFYRILLLIGGNRELQRLFPAIGTHIIHAQYPSPRMQGIRLADYQQMAGAIMAGDAKAAEVAATAHVDHVRAVITELSQS
ncbi:MAG: GntR family transcriptional regulator [Novosphingobium sp.]